MSMKETLIRMNTTRNVGAWDRVGRALLPIAVLGLWWFEVLPAVGAIVLGILSVLLLPTAMTGACSIYYLVGVSTCPASSAAGGAKPQ